MRADTSRSAARSHAHANRSYAVDPSGRLIAGDDGRPPTALAELVHDAFRGLVGSRRFSCVGAKSAVQQGQYRFGLYGALASRTTTVALARDLQAFARAYPSARGPFASCVASFTGPAAVDERAFEALLWRQLQLLHDADSDAWNPKVSDDPDHASFAFSFAGCALFVIGLHAASHRMARRFAWPTLVFNPQDQFDRLRAKGKFRAFRDVIRERERTLQGSVLSTLADFGDASAAKQYAGRRIGPGWQCPFRGKAARAAG